MPQKGNGIGLYTKHSYVYSTGCQVSSGCIHSISNKNNRNNKNSNNKNDYPPWLSLLIINLVLQCCLYGREKPIGYSYHGWFGVPMNWPQEILLEIQYVQYVCMYARMDMKLKACHICCTVANNSKTTVQRDTINQQIKYNKKENHAKQSHIITNQYTT